MYYIGFIGIPHFITFYKSKPYNYLKCAQNHIKKISSELPYSAFNLSRFSYIVLSSSLDLSRLVEEMYFNV